MSFFVKSILPLSFCFFFLTHCSQPTSNDESTLKLKDLSKKKINASTLSYYLKHVIDNKLTPILEYYKAVSEAPGQLDVAEEFKCSEDYLTFVHEVLIAHNLYSKDYSYVDDFQKIAANCFQFGDDFVDHADVLGFMLNSEASTKSGVSTENLFTEFKDEYLSKNRYVPSAVYYYFIMKRLLSTKELFDFGIPEIQKTELTDAVAKLDQFDCFVDENSGKSQDLVMNLLSTNSWSSPYLGFLLDVTYEKCISSLQEFSRFDDIIEFVTFLPDRRISSILDMRFASSLVFQDEGIEAYQIYFDAIKDVISPWNVIPYPQAAPYNRAILEGTICKGSYVKKLKLEESRLYEETYQFWWQGKILPKIALNYINKIESRLGRKFVDSSLLKASIHLFNNEIDEAVQAYAEAMSLCPYEVLSFAPTSVIPQLARIKVGSDKLAIYFSKIGENIVGDMGLNDYLSGYSLASTEFKDIIKGRVSLWSDYLGILEEKGKFAMMRPSNISHQLATRDFVNYPFANFVVRFYNDVDFRSTEVMSGIASSEAIVTTLDRALTTEILVHEIAHQVESTTFTKEVSDCLALLYEKAQENSAFVSGYASTNSKEYFAVSIEAYSTKGEFESQFRSKGSKVSYTYLQEKDPGMVHFIEQVLDAKGDFQSFSCPVQKIEKN